MRVGIVDDSSKKLLTSGYRLEQVRKIILNGIKANERRVKEGKMPGGRKLHRNAGEGSGKRCRKKLLDKSEWFKSKKKSEEQEEQNAEQSHTKSRARQNVQKKLQGVQPGTCLKTRTVLFVEQTKGGGLARVIREVITRIEHILGYRIKVVERSGTSIRNALPNTNHGEDHTIPLGRLQVQEVR